MLILLTYNNKKEKMDCLTWILMSKIDNNQKSEK